MTEESNKYVNNLGTFDSIEAVWERYPEGGHEGDYITIAGERLAWDKYSLSWGTAKTDTSSPRQLYELFGNLYVEGDVDVGGKVSANEIEGEENVPSGDYVDQTRMESYVRNQLSSYSKTTDIASNLLVRASSAESAQSQSAINTTKIYYTVEA